MSIAFHFAYLLYNDLTTSQWLEMREVNTGHVDDGICASHDYCDANMVMLQAFTEIAERSPFGEESGRMEDLDVALWNRAWDHAKRTYLTASSTGTSI